MGNQGKTQNFYLSTMKKTYKRGHGCVYGKMKTFIVLEWSG